MVCEPIVGNPHFPTEGINTRPRIRHQIINLHEDQRREMFKLPGERPWYAHEAAEAAVAATTVGAAAVVTAAKK